MRISHEINIATGIETGASSLKRRRTFRRDQFSGSMSAPLEYLIAQEAIS